MRNLEFESDLYLYGTYLGIQRASYPGWLRLKYYRRTLSSERVVSVRYKLRNTKRVVSGVDTDWSIIIEHWVLERVVFVRYKLRIHEVIPGMVQTLENLYQINIKRLDRSGPNFVCDLTWHQGRFMDGHILTNLPPKQVFYKLLVTFSLVN